MSFRRKLLKPWIVLSFLFELWIAAVYTPMIRYEFARSALIYSHKPGDPPVGVHLPAVAPVDHVVRSSGDGSWSNRATLSSCIHRSAKSLRLASAEEYFRLTPDK